MRWDGREGIYKVVEFDESEKLTDWNRILCLQFQNDSRTSRPLCAIVEGIFVFGF